MLKNYFKVAIRTLLRNRGYASTNIFGLALGIAGATMLMMYVSNELSFDKFHNDSDSTYRLVTSISDGDLRHYAANFPPLAPVLTEEVPEIAEVMTIHQNRSQLNIRMDDQRITEESWYMADQNFFEFFDFELIAGDKSTVLSEPRSMVISESLARKYFGDSQAMGKLIEEFDWGQFKVTGIFKDVPENSHLQFDLIIDSHFRNDERWINQMADWENLRGYTYVKIPSTEGIETATSKMPALLEKYIGENAAITSLAFQPLESIHFGSADIELGLENSNGNNADMYIFSSIALFLLVIAAVNYTNLATSKALFRSKEIGVRKVVGAHKSQLAIQFLAESVVITFLALVLSIGLIDLSLPYFNEITGRSFQMDISSLGEFLPILMVTTLLVGLLSGIYPALFVTRFQPAKVLKGSAATDGKASLKRMLVVVQFGLSIIMIIATLVVSGQMDYIRESNPGFSTKGVMVIDINSGYTRRDFKQMKTAFEAIPGVEKAATASRVPGEWKRINEVDLTTNLEGELLSPVKSFYMSFDADVQEVFDFKLADGSYFSGDDATDSAKVLINATAAKALGLENPIGSLVRVFRTEERDINARVIGIVEDFNFQSFHSTIAPLVIGSWNSGIRSIDYFTLKLETNAVADVIEGVTKVHNEFDPATTIEYNFLDTQLERKYASEKRAGTIFKIGAGLSILVACLGLFGLASFTVQRRTKELGIRKVLGASHWNIFYLLSSSFTRLIVIALLFAVPIAYILMQNWLDNFAYRMPLGADKFVVAGLATITVALLTISYLSIKAVITNPVDSLRSE
ncbi:MAG: FtsX-like permease family protein [Roseivirga sp.]|nr:FtsX-like permease family protein [Roseivirga sp.]